MSMSSSAPSITRYSQWKVLLTLVLSLDGPLETVRRSPEAISVHLSMHELEDRDEAVFSFGFLLPDQRDSWCM